MLAHTLAMFGLPGYWEVIIIILAFLLLFGGRKLPELAKGLGRGLWQFKKELRGVEDDVENLPEPERGKTAQGQLRSSAPAARKHAPCGQDKEEIPAPGPSLLLYPLQEVE